MVFTQNLPVILTSKCSKRLELLKRLHLTPQVISTNIEEIPLPKELPRHLAVRVTQEKSLAAASNILTGYIISTAKIVAVGRRILPKAMNDDMVNHCLKMLSGRRHRVYTSVIITKKQDNQILGSRNVLVQTIVKFKCLHSQEINLYINSQEGLSKPGGYDIQGLAEAFVTLINGSFSNIIGLPLFETKNMLSSLGYRLH